MSDALSAEPPEDQSVQCVLCCGACLALRDCNGFLCSAGQNNGEQKVWIDGSEVLSRNDIKFRHGSGNLIHQLKFECFHGGKSDQFKPSKTQHIA